MLRNHFFYFVLFVSLIDLIPCFTWASCGCASCPLDTHTRESSAKGTVRIDYSFEYIDQHQPRVGREKASVGEIPGDHDEIYTVNRAHRLGVEAGLTDRLSVQVILPYVDRSHQHFDTVESELRAWNINGLGDINFLSRCAFIKPEGEKNPTVSGIIGVKFPTGKRHAKNEEGQEAEVGIQPGSGAYSFIVGASTLQNFSVPTAHGLFAKMPLFFSTTYQWNGKGTANYELGNTWLANVGVVYPILSKLGFMGQINARVAGRDGKGDTDQQVERTGGTFVYVSPGLQFTVTENFLSYVYVQLPVYQRVNVIQLTSNYNLMAGISCRFKACPIP